MSRPLDEMREMLPRSVREAMDALTAAGAVEDADAARAEARSSVEEELEQLDQLESTAEDADLPGSLLAEIRRNAARHRDALRRVRCTLASAGGDETEPMREADRSDGTQTEQDRITLLAELLGEPVEPARRDTSTEEELSEQHRRWQRIAELGRRLSNSSFDGQRRGYIEQFHEVAEAGLADLAEEDLETGDSERTREALKEYVSWQLPLGDRRPSTRLVGALTELAETEDEAPAEAILTALAGLSGSDGTETGFEPIEEHLDAADRIVGRLLDEEG